MIVRLLLMGIVFLFTASLRSNSTSADEPELKKDAVASSLRGVPIYNNALKTASFSPDGTRLAVGSGDGKIRIWDVSNQKVIHTIPAHSKWAFDVEFSPDGKTLVSGGGDNFIKFWNVSDGKLLRTLAGHTDDVHGVAYAENATRLVSGSDDTNVRLWNLETGKPTILTGHSKQVTAVAVSPAGNLAASASRDNTVKLWDLKTAKEVATLREHKGDVLSVVFSRDGKYLATASYDKTIRLWDLSERKSVRTLSGHKQWAFAVAFHPDGKTLLSGAGDRSLRFWNLADGKQTLIYDYLSDISDIIFSQNGKTMAVAFADGSALIYDVGKDRPQFRFPLKAMSKQSPADSKDQRSDFQLYVKLHLSSLDPKNSEWEQSVARLAELGDGYTLTHLQKFEESQLTAAQEEVLRRSSEKIIKRISGETAESLVPAIQRRLERAAFCDLNCNSLESTIVPWVKKSIRQYSKNPDVRRELQRIQSSYVPASVTKTEFGSLKQRVRDYAGELLKDKE